MHPEAHDWVAAHAAPAGSVLDVGGRDINGTVRGLFPGAEYVSLDLRPGPGVDVVADAATWTPDRSYDVVVCCEVFEHTDVWREIIATVHKALKPGGLFVATMAGPGRSAHSAVDGGPHLHDGEHYGNIAPDDLESELKRRGFTAITVDQQPAPADVRCIATKPRVKSKAT